MQQQWTWLAGTLVFDLVQKESDAAAVRVRLRVTLCPPGGCQVCSAGGKGERLSRICSCPSTISHHIVLLRHTGSGFLWSLPFPLILSHLLFLPAVSPLLSTTYIIIFALWMMHLNKKKKNPPTYTTAAALLCPELQDTKQQGKNLTALWVPAGSCQPKPPCLLRVQWQQYTQPGRWECRKGDLHASDVIAVTGHLATSWWQPSACSQTQFHLLGHTLADSLQSESREE